jgi:hypothetical protein
MDKFKSLVFIAFSAAKTRPDMRSTGRGAYRARAICATVAASGNFIRIQIS